jgi:hypothetical protein
MVEYTIEGVNRLPSEWSTMTASKACILGLKRFAFRREYVSMKLKEIGYTALEYVDACDGASESEELYGTSFKGSSYRKAQAISHSSLWKRMVDESIPYLTIFEDDCLPHKNLGNGLGSKFWNDTPKNFDILYIGNMMNPSDPYIVDTVRLVVPTVSYSLHAYIISLEGAKRLLSLLSSLETEEQQPTFAHHLVKWQMEGKLKGICWNGILEQKSYPTYDGGLPWRAFSDIITPQKDTGLVYTNIRLGTTIQGSLLKLTIPPYT